MIFFFISPSIADHSIATAQETWSRTPLDPHCVPKAIVTAGAYNPLHLTTEVGHALHVSARRSKAAPVLNSVAGRHQREDMLSDRPSKLCTRTTR